MHPAPQDGASGDDGGFVEVPGGFEDVAGELVYGTGKVGLVVVTPTGEVVVDVGGVSDVV